MGRKEKMRLDMLIHQKGFFSSREAARRAIMAGLVTYRGEKVDKPGTMVTDDGEILVAKPEHQYVSRGGLKLERAISEFQLRFDDKVVLDVGASTGGFTDCALQSGAKHVYAVDVGYGQLAWRLRTDERVTVYERTNFRHVDPSIFTVQPEIAVMDVSFISTRLLLPQLQQVLASDGYIVSLIKPQFEAGRAAVGKGGIVRDPNVHVEVLHGLIHYVYELGMSCRGLTYSPISGGDGNLEYLGVWDLGRGEFLESEMIDRANQVVELAWRDLRHEEVHILRP